MAAEEYEDEMGDIVRTIAWRVNQIGSIEKALESVRWQETNDGTKKLQWKGKNEKSRLARKQQTILLCNEENDESVSS